MQASEPRGSRGSDEALARLELILTVSRTLARALDDYRPAVAAVAEACVPEFCDLAAIEVVSAAGELETLAYRVNPVSGLDAPAQWQPMGALFAALDGPVLGYSGVEEPEVLTRLRADLHADSVMVAPIATSGVILGWLVCANGRNRRGLRPSALIVADELGSRIGIALQRILLHKEAVRAAQEQSRTARQLRRLAAAAGNMAGAEQPEGVLRTACVEACITLDADAAIAVWQVRGETVARASAGMIDDDAGRLLADALRRRPSKSGEWTALPLPCSDPSHRAAMAVRGRLAEAAESVLASLAALVPVAFERALGTDAALRHEHRFRTVLDASPVALLTARADGTVASANHAALSLFGWDPDRTSFPFPDPVANAMRAAIEDVRRHGRVENRPMTGGDLDLSVSGGPMPAGNDTDETVILAVSDLSEQRRAQRALVQAQRLEAMGQVAGGVAHDFNNLLTVILGYAQMLEARLADSEERELLASIQRAAGRASDLTQRLLSFTRRPSAGTATVDLSGAGRELSDVLGRLLGPDVQLVIDAPGRAIEVLCDPTEVEQIILNLAINARDAMGGRGTLGVRVEAVELSPEEASADGMGPGLYGRLVVTDDGAGMDEATRRRCLEPFFTTKERGKGSGLGLSTVYAIVSERGGHLDITSSPGNGTSVAVMLPAAPPAGRGAAVAPAGAEPVEPALAGATVLLVEDEPDLRELAASTLRQAGATVIDVGTGEEALEAAADGPIDALVTDLVLPGLNGAEVAERVRAEMPSVPVLVISGYAARDGHLAQVLRWATVLRKPYRPEQLRAGVAALLADRVR